MQQHVLRIWPEIGRLITQTCLPLCSLSSLYFRVNLIFTSGLVPDANKKEKSLLLYPHYEARITVNKRLLQLHKGEANLCGNVLSFLPREALTDGGFDAFPWLHQLLLCTHKFIQRCCNVNWGKRGQISSTVCASLKKRGCSVWTDQPLIALTIDCASGLVSVKVSSGNTLNHLQGNKCTQTHTQCYLKSCRAWCLCCLLRRTPPASPSSAL